MNRNAKSRDFIGSDNWISLEFHENLTFRSDIDFPTRNPTGFRRMVESYGIRSDSASDWVTWVIIVGSFTNVFERFCAYFTCKIIIRKHFLWMKIPLFTPSSQSSSESLLVWKFLVFSHIKCKSDNKAGAYKE